MYLTAVMHTDNCTQHMNTYLKKGAGRDSSGCPMVMESQSYSGTDYILKSTSDRAIKDAISLDAEKENMCSLATGLQYSFCVQSAVLAYHIFITKNVLVCLLSSLNLSLCFIQYFLTQSFFPPISLVSHHLLLFLFFSAPVDCGISGIAGRPMGS